MSALITTAERAFLTQRNVVAAQFIELDLPSGVARFHSGTGPLVVDGETWLGVTDSVSGMTAAIDVIRDPYVGEAAAATLVLVGANLEFVRSVHATRQQIEGRSASIYFCALDAETLKPLMTLKPLLLDGYMSSPTIQHLGIGVRTIALTIETIWSAKNFAPGYTWNAAGQRRLFPGDKGFDLVGVKVTEQIK